VDAFGTPSSPAERLLLCACAALAAAGNIAGVALLGDVPGAYHPDALDLWAAGVAAAPGLSAASGLAFVFGLLALAGWGTLLARRAPGLAAAAGAALVATGACLNAAGSLAVPVLAWHVLPGCGPPGSPLGGATGCGAVARALLGGALSVDALFNLLLGVGLVCLAAGLRRARAVPGWLALLGLLAGVACVPVAGQITSPAAQRLLAVAGPLWLAFVLLTAWPRRGSAPAGGRARPTAPAARAG